MNQSPQEKMIDQITTADEVGRHVITHRELCEIIATHITEQATVQLWKNDWPVDAKVYFEPDEDGNPQLVFERVLP